MATMSYLKSRFNELLKDLRTAKNQSMQWFTDAIRQISGSKTQVQQRKRLEPIRAMSPKLAGRMVCFFYDPKWKDKLPYYDRFPLVFPVSFGRGYFIGINVHYLPPQLRLRFFEQLMNVIGDRHLNERTRLNITYQTLERTMGIPYYKPAVKKYLYGHLRSKIYVVKPEDWELTLMLPTERFSKRSKEYVWKESRNKIGYN